MDHPREMGGMVSCGKGEMGVVGVEGNVSIKNNAKELMLNVES